MPCSNTYVDRDGNEFPCGHCNACRSIYRMDWCFRLSEEQRVCYSSHFITLTYGPEELPASECGLGSLDKRDTQLFVKRLRRFQDRQYDGLVPVRFYLVGEYGDRFGRPHYHGIFFNLIPDTVEQIPRIWSKGHVHIGTVTDASIGYVTSYVLTKQFQAGREPPFATMSRRPGIGTQYLTPAMVEFHQDGNLDFVSRHGRKFHMPRLFRYKIFSQEKRAELRRRQLLMMDAKYELEVERLKKFHPDPHFYYRERQRFANDCVGSRLEFKF